MSKPTYTQIAQRAGVGTATVERVLNGRGGVRVPTVEKVLLAARDLDWPGRLPDIHRGLLRIEVLLVRPETSFYARLSGAFKRIAATLDPSVQVQVNFLKEHDPLSIAARIANDPSRRSGLVVSTPDHPAVRAAIAKVRAKGIPVVQVVTRTDPDLPFVGIDNYAAGKMAALMVRRLWGRSGTLAAICHSQVYPVHRDRMRGFADFLAQTPAPDQTFAQVYFSHDDRDLGSARIAEALRAWPDLTAVYNAGGANTGLVDALRRSGRRVFFVGHELNEITQRGLEDGTVDVVFDQLPEAQARRATDLLMYQLGLLKEPVDNPPIRFTTITAVNL